MASPPPPASIPRYLLRIQYDGTHFHGFQRQLNARTGRGLALFTKGWHFHARYFAKTHPNPIDDSVVHVTNLTPPGSDNPSRAYGGRHRLM
jgi:hypothetical protein